MVVAGTPVAAVAFVLGGGTVIAGLAEATAVVVLVLLVRTVEGFRLVAAVLALVHAEVTSSKPINQPRRRIFELYASGELAN